MFLLRGGEKKTFKYENLENEIEKHHNHSSSPATNILLKIKKRKKKKKDLVEHQMITLQGKEEG